MKGSDIKNFRKKHHLTQAELAEIVGVKTGTVSKWESGMRNMGQSALKILEAYTDNLPKNGKTFPLEARIEDLIAQKVFDKLQPNIDKLTNEVVNNIMVIHTELSVIRENLENIQKQQEKAAEFIKKRL